MSIKAGSKGILAITGAALIAFYGCGQKQETSQAPAAPAAEQQAQQAQPAIPQPAEGQGGALPAGHPTVANQGQPAPVAATGAQGAPGALPVGHPTGGAKPGEAKPKPQRDVQLTSEVKARWSEVKVEITDKASKAKEALTLKVGATTALKKAGLKLKVEALVPDYSMTDTSIVSKTNEAKNPAMLVELFENDKSVAKGWIFKNFPDFNSFNDNRLQVQLVAPGPEKK